MTRLYKVDRIEQGPANAAQAGGPAVQQQLAAENVAVGNIPGSFSQDYSTSLVIETLDVGQPWTTGLLDCLENPTNAIVTAIFPCATFGQIAEVLDEGRLTCSTGTAVYMLMIPALCSQWIMGSKYRAKLRKNYNLVGAPHADIISHVFCPFCSLCQEFRELGHRGLDPALGWNGIHAQRKAKKNHNLQVNVAPPSQSMSR